MSCNCKIKLTLKSEHATIKSSPLITRPVNLSTLPESDYAMFATVFPEAFELKKECNCKNECSCKGECECNKETKMDKAIREVKEFINKSKNN